MKMYKLILTLGICVLFAKEGSGDTNRLFAQVKYSDTGNYKVRLEYVTQIVLLAIYKKFYVERALHENGPWVEITSFIPNAVGGYIWEDNNIDAFQYWYRVRNDLRVGADSYSNTVDVPVNSWRIVIFNEDEIQCHTNEVKEVFFDDFNGSEVNDLVWNKDFYGLIDINHYAYTNPTNPICSDGELIVETKRKYSTQHIPTYNPDAPTYNFEYETGKIETRNKWKYGIFQAEIKIEEGPGYWPTFWLWGKNPETNGMYQPNNEIDICEFWNEKRNPEKLWHE